MSIKLNEFKIIDTQGGAGYYSWKFSYSDFDFEICLEPCMGGYCVGLYHNNSLVRDKECTDLEGDRHEAILEALNIASRFYREQCRILPKPVPEWVHALGQ